MKLGGVAGFPARGQPEELSSHQDELPLAGLIYNIFFPLSSCLFLVELYMGKIRMMAGPDSGTEFSHT